VGQTDPPVIGDHGEADARPVPQVIGDVEQRGHDLIVRGLGVLGRGLGRCLPDIRVDRQGSGGRQRLRLGHLGDGARPDPCECPRHQCEGDDDERELTDQHTMGERMAGPGHALTVRTGERNAQKVVNDQNAISAHKRARHVIWTLRCFQPHIRLRRRSPCSSFSASP
jgi:hypothetical protein